MCLVISEINVIFATGLIQMLCDVNGNFDFVYENQAIGAYLTKCGSVVFTLCIGVQEPLFHGPDLANPAVF